MLPSVSYRDETDALHARIAQLEQENAELSRRNEALAAGRQDDATARGWLGGPTRVDHERVFEGDLPASTHERVVEVLRERFRAVGETTVLGNTLTWRIGPPSMPRAIEVVLSARDGQTRLRISERNGNLAGGLFGGLLGGMGGGLVGVILPLVTMTEGFLTALALSTAWLGLTYLGVRALYGRAVSRRERELRTAAEEVDAVIERALAASATKVRVQAPEEADEDDATRGEQASRARRA
jgi:hypothetical protein